MSPSSSQPFYVHHVDPDSAEIVEQMGSKAKFWFDHPEFGVSLFKAAREDTGEDWAEKVAQELCTLLHLPNARYELAMSGGQPGIISPRFLDKAQILVHGNELLAGQSTEFATATEEQSGRTSAYTIPLVLETIEHSGAEPPASWALPPGVLTATDVFVGELLLDAWVGNTDRHQENWGVVETQIEKGSTHRHLTPVFDTASCLGRNELDVQRERRIRSHDSGFTVEAYADRARSPFYSVGNAPTRLTTYDAFLQAAGIKPDAAVAWIRELQRIDTAAIEGLFDRFPAARPTAIARQFSTRMLYHNQARLIASVGAIT
jgi:hypothetical protein